MNCVNIHKVIMALLFVLTIITLLFIINQIGNFFPKSRSLNNRYPMIISEVAEVTPFDRKELDTSDYLHFYNHTPLLLECNKCAVVSSSGCLLGKKAGPMIDNSSCIIRMNDAPTRGYERDVGSRTDIRVMGYFNIFKHPGLLEKLHDELLDSKYFVLHLGHTTGDICNNKILKNPVKYIHFLSKWYQNDKPVEFYRFTKNKTMKSKMLLSKFGNEVFSVSGAWAASTGWFTMQFALDVCAHITVYGMVPGDYCQKHLKDPTPYHYYGNKKLKECSYVNRLDNSKGLAHRMSLEKLIFGNWASQRGNIEFRFPSWDLTKNKREEESDALKRPIIKTRKKANQNNKQRKIIIRRRIKNNKKNNIGDRIDD